MQPITVYFPGLETTFGPFNPPESTKNSIILPFNLSSKIFSRDVYSAKLTQGRASVDDINQFLTLVELVLSRLETTSELIIRFLLRMVIPFLLYIFLWDSYWLEHGVGVLYFFYIVNTVAGVIVDRVTEKTNAKNDIQKIVEMMRPAFAKRGLSWHLFDEYFCCWLELRKDEDQTDDQESLVENATQDQTMSDQSVHEKILENFKNEENFKSPPIFTYELIYTEDNQ